MPLACPQYNFQARGTEPCCLVCYYQFLGAVVAARGCYCSTLHAGALDWLMRRPSLPKPFFGCSGASAWRAAWHKSCPVVCRFQQAASSATHCALQCCETKDKMALLAPRIPCLTARNARQHAPSRSGCASPSRWCSERQGIGDSRQGCSRHLQGRPVPVSCPSLCQAPVLKHVYT
eukprot:scaffold57926_cov18-Tisochrysis_lutea.AAC.1